MKFCTFQAIGKPGFVSFPALARGEHGQLTQLTYRITAPAAII
jgi:hypothetical protein